MSERGLTPKTVAPALQSVPSGLLQRQCACGNHTIAGSECEECHKKREGMLQRAPVSAAPVNGVPPIVHDALRLPGHQPDAATRAFMEPRFGRDFSRIPTHSPAVGVIQTKLAINKPGDEYEQEADRIADQVLAAPTHSVVSGAYPHIQRFVRQSTGETELAPASVDRVLASPGKPLEPALRQDMELRFGYDFSRVRVHSGAAAEQSARDVNAHAYTVGHSIVFGAGRFSSGMDEGRRLIAHELTHVVQQSAADEMSVGQSNEKRGLSPISQRATVPQGSRALALLGLQADHGNRQIAHRAQTLSRKPTTATVYLGSSPPAKPRIPWVEKATPENWRLAGMMDDLEKLTDAELAKRREEARVGAVAPVGDDQRVALQTLEAIESVASGRGGLAPDMPYYSGYDSQNRLPTRRINVRLEIEKVVRETGSFKQALAAYPYIEDSDVEFFQAEADRFAIEFKGQARLTVERMLKDSGQAIRKVLDSYGLPFDSARFAAERLARGSDVDTEAEGVVKVATKSSDIDAPDRVRHRVRLAQWVEYLKKRQQTVKKHQQTADDLFERWRKDRSNVDTNNRALKTEKELNAARNELKVAWIEAERLHPILATYRRGGELEKINLGTLNTDPVERRMKTVLVQLLPKMADIGKAIHLIKIKRLDPLALPSVVALTRANMFIPKDSIRDGVANDLAAAAMDDDSVWVKVAAFALAIVTLIPSGGTSLAIPAGIAAAGLAAYSAAKEWEKYGTQKTLVNTDIDLARSLSTEEPSLTGFAVSLVSLGLEGFPLIGAFNKARKLKELVNTGKDTTLAVRELNAIGKSRGASDDLGEQALREIRAEQKVLFKKDLDDGHAIVVTDDGIRLCSPPPCSLLRRRYAQELADNTRLKEQLDFAERLRNADPHLAEAEAEEVYKELKRLRGQSKAASSTSGRAKVPQYLRDIDRLQSEAQGVASARRELAEAVEARMPPGTEVRVVKTERSEAGIAQGRVGSRGARLPDPDIEYEINLPNALREKAGLPKRGTGRSAQSGVFKPDDIRFFGKKGEDFLFVDHKEVQAIWKESFYASDKGRGKLAAMLERHLGIARSMGPRCKGFAYTTNESELAKLLAEGIEKLGPNAKGLLFPPGYWPKAT